MTDYWQEKPKQHIVCAACRYGGTVLAGPRHWDSVMREQYKRLRHALRVPPEKFDQGFLDQFGEFLSREEAYQIAKRNGQPINEERNRHGMQLFSEGLY